MKHVKQFRIYKLNESSYKDFTDNYISEIYIALRKLRKLKIVEPTEEQYDELDSRLQNYDDNVIQTIEHWIMGYVDKDEIAKFAIENLNRFGTEPKMILYAIDDYYDVVIGEQSNLQENFNKKIKGK